MFRDVVRAVVPYRTRAWARRKRALVGRTPVGTVDLGDFRSLTPLSPNFGFDRGLPVDRYYIEHFLQLAADEGVVSGRVLEIGEDLYASRFGGESVDCIDVLNLVEGSSGTTLVGDLTSADHIRSKSFDCIICTQTLHFIYDVPAAMRTLSRLLGTKGVLLATAPGISKICRDGGDQWLDQWRFTSVSLGRVAAEAFPHDGISIRAYGNVLTAAAFLHGLAAEELSREQLLAHDPDFEVLLALRAVKSGAPSCQSTRG